MHEQVMALLSTMVHQVRPRVGTLFRVDDHLYIAIVVRQPKLYE